MKWVRKYESHALFIFDNCDKRFTANHESLQEFHSLRTQSEVVKYILTSRIRIMDTKRFRLYELRNISDEASVEMLGKLAPSLMHQTRKGQHIANLIGNCSLALDILGGLLKIDDAPNAEKLIENMEKRLLKTLNLSELTPERRLDICINGAYDFTPPAFEYFVLSHLYSPRTQEFSHFPASFDQPSAFEIVFNLTSHEISNPSQQR